MTDEDAQALQLLSGAVQDQSGERYRIFVQWHPPRPYPTQPIALTILLDPHPESPESTS